jgi:hypothetical protein
MEGEMNQNDCHAELLKSLAGLDTIDSSKSFGYRDMRSLHRFWARQT